MSKVRATYIYILICKTWHIRFQIRSRDLRLVLCCTACFEILIYYMLIHITIHCTNCSTYEFQHIILNPLILNTSAEVYKLLFLRLIQANNGTVLLLWIKTINTKCEENNIIDPELNHTYIIVFIVYCTDACVPVHNIYRYGNLLRVT